MFSFLASSEYIRWGREPVPASVVFCLVRRSYLMELVVVNECLAEQLSNCARSYGYETFVCVRFYWFVMS